MVRVWDAFVRIAHWSLVVAVVASWLTRHGGGRLHEWLGYAALAIVVARVVWGFVGPVTARFRNFVRWLRKRCATRFWWVGAVRRATLATIRSAGG